MEKIENVISRLLKENTGIAMCDSGGAYGRNWQTNKDKCFDKEPRVKVETYSDNDVSLSISTYHFLVEHLEITPTSDKLNKELKKFMDKSDNHYLADMGEFASQFDKSTNATNTYNFENLLDQVLQFVTFKHDGDDYIILQVHGGCDVRGGYTTPQIFAVSDDIEYFYIHMTDINCYDKKGNNWYSDDSGYSWYSNNDEHDLKFKVNDNKVFDVKTGNELYFGVGW